MGAKQMQSNAKQAQPMACSSETKVALEKSLQSNDRVAGLERLEMLVTRIHHPFAKVARIEGKINPTQPPLWAKPNIVVRIEVGQQEQDHRPLTRVYTVRNFDLATHLVEIDFIIHEGDAPAMHWLDRAKKGTSVFINGPRQHVIPDYHLDKNIVFFADDTAIPALYSILNQWPQEEIQKEKQAVVYIDCAEADYAAQLPSIAGVTYHIKVRGEDEFPGKNGYLSTMAKRFKNGRDWQIWIACERQEAREIRQHFMDQWGIDKDKMRAVGYWQHGVSASQIDTARLAYYAQLHAIGKGLPQHEELDVPV